MLLTTGRLSGKLSPVSRGIEASKMESGNSTRSFWQGFADEPAGSASQEAKAGARSRSDQTRQSAS